MKLLFKKEIFNKKNNNIQSLMLNEDVNLYDKKYCCY